jgi:hypothetical protein
MDFNLPNGYIVSFYAQDNEIGIELVNSKGFVITSRSLTDEELKTLSEKFAE